MHMACSDTPEIPTYWRRDFSFEGACFLRCSQVGRRLYQIGSVPTLKTICSKSPFSTAIL